MNAKRIIRLGLAALLTAVVVFGILIARVILQRPTGEEYLRNMTPPPGSPDPRLTEESRKWLESLDATEGTEVRSKKEPQPSVRGDGKPAPQP